MNYGRVGGAAQNDLTPIRVGPTQNNRKFDISHFGVRTENNGVNQYDLVYSSDKTSARLSCAETEVLALMTVVSRSADVIA